MPAVVPAICDLIRPAKDEERVWAVFPSELLQYVRQYTSEIQMPYGREMLVASWDHTEHPLYALMEAETIHIDLVAELLDDYGVQYLILNRAEAREGRALGMRAGKDRGDRRIRRAPEYGRAGL